MKNLAIIVTGNTRGLYDKWMEYTFPILSSINGCKSYFFFQTWDNNFIPCHLKSNQFVIENFAFEYETHNVLNSKYDIVLSQIEIYNEITHIIRTNSDIIDSKYEELFREKENEISDYSAYVDLCNYYSQPYSWKKTYESVKKYEQDHSINFDYAIKVRYDCFFRNNFKEVIEYFENVNSDFLHPAYSVWRNFKTPIKDRNDLLPNGISDQWFSFKFSETTHAAMINLIKTMFKTNHNSIACNRNYCFEQCLYMSLLSYNVILSTKYYEFLIMRNFWGFDDTYKKFKTYGIIPENIMAFPSKMGDKIRNLINNKNNSY